LKACLEADHDVVTLPTWWVKYYRDGKPFSESAETDKKKKAEQLLKDREGDIVKGVPISPRMSRLRFDEAKDDLVNDYKVNAKRSLKTLELRLRKHVTPFFGGRRMTSISTSDVRKYVKQRQDEKASNGAINRELTHLKRMFTLAMQASKLISRPHIPMLKEN